MEDTCRTDPVDNSYPSKPDNSQGPNPTDSVPAV